jgi:hypothetical protein
MSQFPRSTPPAAVTVHAPPEIIYPWIVQIGVTLAGWWYSYDLLDNLGRPSATFQFGSIWNFIGNFWIVRAMAANNSANQTG